MTAHQGLRHDQRRLLEAWADEIRRDEQRLTHSKKMLRKQMDALIREGYSAEMVERAGQLEVGV